MNPILLLAALAAPVLQAPAPGGVVTHLEGAEPGYALLAPLRSTETLLVDDAGQVVHRWTSEFTPGNAADLLPNGNLLRAAKRGGNERFRGGGEGGLLEQFTWDGELVWTCELSSSEQLQHHDFEVLPNGNVLVLVWESRSRAEALAAGRRPDAVGDTGLWPDAVLELRPKSPEGAEVVWEWHAWDHLIQDQDPELPGFGDPAAHPERLDVNIGARDLSELESEEDKRAREELEAQLSALGYLGDHEAGDAEGDAEGEGDHDAGRERDGADWMHTNAVDYEPELDLIVLSARNFNELLVLDHSTTTREAAGSTGGRHGRGGDILWRWGNPENYGRGGAEQQELFSQHDARWVRAGESLALTVFNNGRDRPGGDYSSVDRLDLPLSEEGTLRVPEKGPCLPERAAWSYTAPVKEDFYSSHISGAMALTEGRVLVCDGEAGRVFQVDREGKVLWDFRSPFGGERSDGPPGARADRTGEADGARGPRDERRGRGPGGPPGGPGRDHDGGPGRGPGRGPGEANALFRAVHIPLDHPGLVHLDGAEVR